jgi:hypothetical protein
MAVASTAKPGAHQARPYSEPVGAGLVHARSDYAEPVGAWLDHALAPARTAATTRL